MTVREVRASGHEALLLVSGLLQRARLADATAGIWEAADPQWWSRRPRRSDDVEQLFWVDDEGPVAATYLTHWNDVWQCDLMSVPGAAPPVGELWAAARAQLAQVGDDRVEVPVREDDRALRDVVEDAGFTAGDGSWESWLTAAERPDVVAPAAGYVVTDRSRRLDRPHPMAPRNGDAVAERLAACPLYDPALDLVVETEDGEPAAYALLWCDPVTEVGLVEPVRVEDAHQRRGLATAMVTEGVARLVDRGAERIKIGFESEAARAVYVGVGFVPGPFTTWYRSPR